MHVALEAHKPRWELPQYFVLKREADGSLSFAIWELAGGLKGIVGAVDRKSYEEVSNMLTLAFQGYELTRMDYEHFGNLLLSCEKQAIDVLLVHGMAQGFDANGNRPMFGVPIKRVIAELALSQHDEGFDKNTRIFVPLDAYALDVKVSGRSNAPSGRNEQQPF